MSTPQNHTEWDSTTSLEDRLRALRGVYADHLGLPYDVQDAKGCALRVLSDLLAREQWRREQQHRIDKAHVEFVQRYRALAESDLNNIELSAALNKVSPEIKDLTPVEVSLLLRRCIREISSSTAANALRQEISSLHAVELADVETAYRALLAGPMAESTPSQTSPVDLDALQGRLQRLFPSITNLKVASGIRIHGGYSKSTSIIDIGSDHELPREVVIRSDSGFDYAATSVADEFPLLVALSESGVAVPEPLGLSPASETEPAAMVVGKLNGATFGSPFTAKVRSKELNRQLGYHLASIHAVPIKSLGFVADQGLDQLQQRLDDIDTAWRYLDETGVDMPIIENALCWLRENVTLGVGTRTLTHGDYGPHNLLADSGRVTGIVDWEFARIGNPIADLCWTRRAATALDTWENFVDAYRLAGGVAASDLEIKYFSIMANTQLGVSILRTTIVLHRNPDSGIRNAVPMAERLRPLLLDLDRMLAGNDH